VSAAGAQAPSTVNRRILRAAGAVTAASVVVKVVATVKEFTVAGVYGRIDAMDAFIAAAFIPGLLINLISESMNQALVPTLVRVREQEGRAAARRLLSSSMLWMCLLLAAVSVVMGLFARVFFPLIAWNFSAPKLDLAVRLFYGMLPIVLITGIATTCTAVLNTAGRFAIPSLVPVLTPLCIIVSTMFLSSRLGIWALAYATVIGAAIHAIWMILAMHCRGYPFSLRWHGMNAATKEIAQQFGTVVLSSVVASGGLLIDQIMAATLPAGSVSALAYAGRFVSVVLTLVGGAVSSAIIPVFSELVAQRDWTVCRRTLRTWLLWTTMISIPICGALIVGARILVRLTFQHGVFGPGDTNAVAPVLALYALQIPFFVCSRVLYWFLLAMRRADLLFYCGLLNLVLDVVLNLVLVRWLGLAGIALATSLWTVSTLIFLWYWSWRVLVSCDPTAGTGFEGMR
jgi:putative peptidoglycan lipid II flippase